MYIYIYIYIYTHNGYIQAMAKKKPRWIGSCGIYVFAGPGGPFLLSVYYHFIIIFMITTVISTSVFHDFNAAI